MARQVAKLLLAAGIDAKVYDVRDANGTRFDAVNLIALGALRILVRPVGWTPAKMGLDALAIGSGAWVQRGASAEHVAPLIWRLNWLKRQPWPTNPQDGKPLLLKK